MRTHLTTNVPTTARVVASSIQERPFSWSPLQPAVLVHPRIWTSWNTIGSSRTWIVCGRGDTGGQRQCDDEGGECPQALHSHDVRGGITVRCPGRTARRR